jgi:tetratricopeptide (TPR) repeat protein
MLPVRAPRRLVAVLLSIGMAGGAHAYVRAQESPESRGEAAENLGRWNEAFRSYQDAFKALPDPPAATDEQRVREKIIRVVGHLTTKPTIPDEAQAHLKKADDILAVEGILGPGDGSAPQKAVVELHQAIRVAPWWPEATLRLAKTLQRLQRTDAALMNLNLYQLADPAGYAALASSTPSAPGGTVATVAPRPPGAATVYLYFLPMSTMGIKPKALCDDQLLATVQAGHFIKFSVPPGIHLIKFYDQKISAPFRAGQEQYIRVSKEGFVAHLALNFVTPEEALAEIRERGIVPNNADRNISDECKPAPTKNGVGVK